MFNMELLFRINGFVYSYRTPRLNEVIRLIYTMGKDLQETKNRKRNEISHLSGWVVVRN